MVTVDGVQSEPQEIGSPQIIHPFADEGNYDAVQIVREYRVHRDFYQSPNPDEFVRDADFPWAILCVQRIVGIVAGVVTFQRVFANIPPMLTTWGSKVFEKPAFGESWRGRRIYTLDSETQIIADSELPITGDTQGQVTGGTFTLTALSQTTGSLAYNATAAQVEAALNGLSNVAAAGGVTVSGSQLSGYTVAPKFSSTSFSVVANAGSLTPTATVQSQRAIILSDSTAFTLTDSVGAGTQVDRTVHVWQTITRQSSRAFVTADGMSGFTGGADSIVLNRYLFSFALPVSPASAYTLAQMEDAIQSGMSGWGVSNMGFSVVLNSPGNYTITFSGVGAVKTTSSLVGLGATADSYGIAASVGIDKIPGTTNGLRGSNAGATVTPPGRLPYVISRFRFHTSARSFTITGHGRTATAPGWVVDGQGGVVRIPSLTVVDANTLSTDGAIDLAGSSSLLVNPRKYRPGNVVSRVRRTREFFAPGLTPGIAAPQDMPTIQPSTAQEYLDAVMTNTAGVELVVEADEVTRYIGPIFMQQKTVLMVENATEELA